MKNVYYADVISMKDDVVVFVKKDGKLVDVIFDSVAARRLFRSLLSYISKRFGNDVEVFIFKAKDVNKILEEVVSE